MRGEGLKVGGRVGLGLTLNLIRRDLRIFLITLDLGYFCP